MSTLYERIVALCAREGINISQMCSKAGVTRGAMTDFKMGRTKKLSTDTLEKLSNFFGVSIDYLLSGEESTENEKRPVYDDEAWAMMEEMHKRPELKALFKTTKNVKPEDIKAVDDLLKRMARESGYDT